MAAGVAGRCRFVGRFCGGVEVVAYLVPVMVVWSRRCWCQGWPAPMDVQSQGENLAWFLCAGGGDATCAIHLPEGVFGDSVRRGQAKVKRPTRVLLQRCWHLRISISFLKASLEHFCSTPLAGAALSCAVPMRASSSSLHWSVQLVRCCYSRLVLCSGCFAAVALP